MTRYVGRDRAYFYLPIWGLIFSIPAFLLLYKLYQSWKRYGGDESYVPPVLVHRPDPAQGAVEP